jgi:hypothetical protein
MDAVKIKIKLSSEIFLYVGEFLAVGFRIMRNPYLRAVTLCE